MKSPIKYGYVYNNFALIFRLSYLKQCVLIYTASLKINKILLFLKFSRVLSVKEILVITFKKSKR